MSVIEKIDEHTIYESPAAQQPPLNARFPGIVQMGSGELVALYVLAEVFDKTIAHMYVSRSNDFGKTWQFQGEMYDTKKAGLDFEYDEAVKPTLMGDGTLIALGYRFNRPDLELENPNPDTGGFLYGPNVVSFSRDDGKTWSLPEIIDCGIPETVETSGPAILTRSGDLLATGPAFTLWDGSNPTGHDGILLRSKDKGISWDSSVRFYIDPINDTAPFETRISQMQDGRLVVIAWAYNLKENKHYTNHVTVSHDNGYTWSDPIDTGHMDQASNLMCLKDDLLLTIHSRRAGENVGLYIRLIDFSNDKWNMLEEEIIWGNVKAQAGPKSVADQMAGLKFGQPSLLQLDNAEILATHWGKEGNLTKIKTHRLKLNM